jgi:hypothetical protein
MKKYAVITMAILLVISQLHSQEQEEMKYLFSGSNSNISVSGFAGVFNEFSAFDNDFAFSMGGGAALLLNQKFYFGAYGMGLTTRHIRSYDVYNYDDEENKLTEDLYTRFGHGGLWLGYIHKPKNAIHWGVNVKTGWGSISLNDLRYPGSDYKWENYDIDNVFVFIPEVNLGMNILKWMRVNVGAGYRLVTGVNQTYTYLENGTLTEKNYFDKDALNSFTGNVTLAFGWFNK